jgi:hypothetical protein
VAKTAPEDTGAAQARAFGLAGYQVRQPACGRHTRDQDDKRHQRPSGEGDYLVHGLLQGGEAQNAQGPRDPGYEYAPEDDKAQEIRGPTPVAELPKRVRSPGPPGDLVQSYGFE